MLISEERKAKFPDAVAILRFPEIPSPQWFNHRGGSQMNAVVTERGVVVHGDLLELVDGVLPAVGTEVKLLFDKSLLFVEKRADHDARLKKQAEEDEERRRIAHRAQLGDLQARAEAANAKLNIPVRWTSGEKTVLSGLGFNSWGDGRNRRTVNHILLLEAVTDGRFIRKAGDFLCTSASGSNGENWTGDPTTHSVGNHGNYVSCINCTQCLKLAARWKDPAKRIEPEVVEPGAAYDNPGF